MLVTIATEPARPGKSNEDFVAATPNVVVLLDGAGSAGTETGCIHSVSWYAARLGSTLLSNAILHDDRPLNELLSVSISDVNELHRPSCDLRHPGTPAATVLVLRQVGNHLDYLVLADSLLVLDVREKDPIVITDDREALIGKRYRTKMDALSGGTLEHDAALREYVAATQLLRNQEDGYWIASSDPNAAHRAVLGTVASEDIRTATLMSDGASRLVDRFRVSGWRDVLDQLHSHGADHVVANVRRVERSDPKGTRWPRGKIHDDASIAHCRHFE